MSQVKISGNASGTGILTVAAPNTNSNYTLTLPAETGTVLTSASSIPSSQITGGVGKVLQVVSTTKTDTFTTTSGSFVDVTGMSVSITPSSTSSRIVVMCSLMMMNLTSTQRFGMKLVRNSTDIFVADAAGSRQRLTAGDQRTNGSGEVSNLSFTGVDSPSTTSSVTYKVQTACFDGGTAAVNRTYGDQDASSLFRTASSITVMEIAG